MCGIIAVIRRPSTRVPPTSALILDGLDAGLAALAEADRQRPGELVQRLAGAGAAVSEVDALLRGLAGVRGLLAGGDLATGVQARVERLEALVEDLERWADSTESTLMGTAVESFNAELVRVRDSVWAVGHDRVRTAQAVGGLAGPAAGEAALAAYTSIQLALSGIDRLEVRGRDSAGVHVLVRDHGLDLGSEVVKRMLGSRQDLLFRSGAVAIPGGKLAFVYKAAAEIGELGDNTKALRAAIAEDELLRLALESGSAQAAVVGHTRWASVGVISQANAHPLNQVEVDREDGPYVAAALNGDVDNHLELLESEALAIPPEITTDAKVIPTLMARRLGEGSGAAEAFRQTVRSFEGSVAIAAATADEPDQLLLALRGSGQALYVGLAEDAFVVASEPYGLVEETSRYVRMDGEVARDGGESGQIVVLDAAGAGATEGITRFGYDGAEMPVDAAEVITAAITTRDIDRGPFPHFLLKEISEAPQSLLKTLRGKLDDDGGRLRATLDHGAVPEAVVGRIADGTVKRVVVVGQGTAAVAGQGVGAFLSRALSAAGISVTAMPATELSGFGLEDDMSDTLVVAISQSGTTTDTNRTVDLVRARDAAVIAIVNRRNSDLVEKADGVLYTSDGRDVEMSVASTKAFYAQIAAGALLAAALGEVVSADREWIHRLLEGLRTLPAAMSEVLAQREQIGLAAQQHAPSRRHWAVVGNGVNRVAAQEIRIKLSELCYKSIACDATEDKKHIDLSAEPLIFVCATGLDGPNADDVAKEVAIYRAHKAAPIVVTSGTGKGFASALHTITVPEVDHELAFVLSAMAGHLFGYEAALAIDALARPLRQARATIEQAAVAADHDSQAVLERLHFELQPVTSTFLEQLRGQSYDGCLEASTAVRIASLLRYAIGLVPLDAYQLDYGRVGTPAVVVEDLTDALTRGIEELTRPVDAIKHQAKTVTVGISRSEEALVDVPLTRAVLGAGASRDRLSYRTLRTLSVLDAAMEEVTGYTRYRIEGSVGDGTATAVVVDQGGSAASLSSRTRSNPELRGAKHRVATLQEVTAGRGRDDGRSIVIVPETKNKQTTGLTLLHVRFKGRLPATEARRVLEGYQGRYSALKDAVTETQPAFDDEVLGRVPIVDLLDQPVYVLAEHWVK